MLARYVEFVDRSRAPALIRLARRRELYANAPAQRLLDEPDAAQKLAAAFDEAERSGSAFQQRILDAELTVLPLYDARDRIDATLAVGAELGELPSILNTLHSGAWHFSQILHLLPHIVLTARPNGQIDYVSRRWYEMTGVPQFARGPHEAVTRAIDHVDAQRFADAWREGVASRNDFGFELRISTLAGTRWHELRATPWIAEGSVVKWVAALTDIELEVAARDALARSQSRLQYIAELARFLSRSADPMEIARGVAELAAIRFQGKCVVQFREGDGERQSAAHPTDGRLPADPIAAIVAGSHGSIVVEVPWGPKFDVRPLIAASFGERESVRGFVGIVRTEALPFDDDDHALLAEMVSRLETALKRALSYRRERRLAQFLQRAMLPVSLPYVPGVRFDAVYEPAGKEMLVGGDWYDAFALPDGRVALAIGDVAGHGLDSAVVMGHVRHSIRVAAFEDPSPSTVLAHANRAARAERDTMVTAFFGVLDALTLRLDYASAGHPAGIVVEPNGALTPLVANGIPLGVSEQFSVDAYSADLGQSAALVLFTDGLTEVGHDPIAGEERLHDALSGWASGGFVDTALQLQSRVLDSRVPSDDVALFVVRFPSLDDLDLTIEATSQDAQRIRSALRRFLATAPLEDARSSGFVLAVCEAVNNAVEHAYRECSGQVRLRLARDAVGITATITDHGRWSEGSSPDRGNGLVLMRGLSDAFDVEHDGNGTTVRMRIRTLYGLDRTASG